MSQQMGVTIRDGVGTIRVYSASASSVVFCMLDPTDSTVILREIPLSREGDIWSASDPDIAVGVHYALRADGEKTPNSGFNPTINLIDPYAKGVVRKSGREYHCVIVDDAFDWQGVSKPNTPLAGSIIYEAHARGLTRGNKALPDELRGTYAALGHETTIAHLKNIGVTAVELLPIHLFISEPRLINMGLINYWGYNSINFFAPHHRYATSAAKDEGPDAMIRELKTAIRELHRNGIEVILDVVYNHTAEGGNQGLTHSYRGLDNANYYRQDEHGNYHDTTGCGNSLNFGNPHVVELVLASLRYWTNEMQIDGYRFDLATTLARNGDNHYDPNHPLLRAIVDDPTFAETKMIVEPWDVGLGGWQTGNFPDRFSEWNDHYRDSVRKFWLSDIANARNSGNHWNGVADLATRLAGSRDIVDGPSGPLGGVNFITAHDGFTLHDLVSYDVKHNQVNGESNRDGTNNNHSFNHGSEGEQADPSIHLQRRKAERNLLGTLLLSSGIPMVTAGDERSKTQPGNNNAYCQDTVLSWVNWEPTRTQLDLEATFAHLTKLRRENPVLRPSSFGDFESATAEHDMIRWFNAAGELMTEENWHDGECRTVQRYGVHIREDGSQNRMLLVIHGSEKATEIKLPTEITDAGFDLVWNSALELPPTEIVRFEPLSTVPVSGTSMLLFNIN